MCGKYDIVLYYAQWQGTQEWGSSHRHQAFAIAKRNERDTMWFKFLQDNGFYEKGWDCDPDGAVFYCPEDGNGIEPDGVCFCGNQSPLLQMGMI